MLAAVSPEQFDEWVAFDKIEPDPLEKIRVILKYGLSALTQGLPVKPNDLDPVHVEAAPAVNNVSPQQAVALLRMAYGG
jgi:hypothetical protein